MLVSVVIPVFNAAPYVEESIDSVLAQGYENLEVIAVDNMSKDQSLEILKRYGDRIRVLQQARPGVAAARNLGVSAARGDLIAFNDADDVWLPGKLKKQVEFLSLHPDIGIVFGSFADWWPNADGSFSDPSHLVADRTCWNVTDELSGWIYAQTLILCTIAMITPVVRRSVFERVGLFDESLVAGSDYEFWLRATFAFRAHKLDECVALYRHQPESVTNTLRSWNSIDQILHHAIENQGVVAPDGSRPTSRDLNRRIADNWLEFGLLHMKRGSASVGLSSILKYVRFEPEKARAVSVVARLLPWTLRERINTKG